MPGLPKLRRPLFPACRAQYPGGPNRCLSVSSRLVQPSPVNRRVGIHIFTFEACSSFTRVTACRIACPPKSGLLSRGFDPASCPTGPLSSFHVYRQLHGWIPPPQVISAVSAPVESRKGAVPESYCMPTRFPSPLIKPDVPVSSIRLSDRLHQLAHGSGPQMHIAEP